MQTVAGFARKSDESLWMDDVVKRGPRRGASIQRHRISGKIRYVKTETPPASEPASGGGDGGPVAEPGGTGSGSAGRPFVGGRIVTARSEFIRPADPGLVPTRLREHLNDHQVQGAAFAIRAMNEHGGALIADGTGTGKTRTQLSVAQAFAAQGKKVLLVTKAEVIKPDWKKSKVTGSFDADSRAMGVSLELTRGEKPLAAGTISLSTYDNLAKLKNQVDKNTVLILDEAHALREWTSHRSKTGYQMCKQAGSVLYATATPADKPLQIAYLFRAKVFGDRSWDDTYRELGMRQVDVRTPTGTIQKWEIDPRVGGAEVYRRLAGLFDRMTQDGLMLKREISFDGVEVDFKRLSMPPECHQAMDRVKEILSADEDLQDRVADVYDRLSMLRRTQHGLAEDLHGIRDGNAGYSMSMLEETQRRYAEVGQRVQQAQDELDALRRRSRNRNEGLRKAQILMSQRRQQEPYKIPAVVEETRRELAEGRQVVVFVDRVNESEVGEVQSEGTVKLLRQALEDAGVSPGLIGDLHGGVTPKKRREAMDRFQDGQVRVIIATGGAGGTGVNLDDIHGDRPRTLLMMTSPFSAIENVQRCGRVWRLKTKSYPRIRYLFGDTAVDDWNASLISGKMKALGAAVGGQVNYLDIPRMDVSADEELERKEAGDAQPEPYAWRPLVRSQEDMQPVRITGDTFPHRHTIKEAGGQWTGTHWQIPRYRAEAIRHLHGLQFDDRPTTTAPPGAIQTRQVNTRYGVRHVHSFPPSAAILAAHQARETPSNVTIRLNDYTGKREASIWGDTADEVRHTHRQLAAQGLV